ncbi:MAG: hypothetical protein AAF675_18455 [Pseudomonadota bacterium]
MRVILVVLPLVLLAVGLFFSGGVMEAAGRWAIDAQRAFQDEMAGAIRALQAGQPGAWLALMAAAGAYGFVHAVGPGHGKYLIGGVGLGSTVSVARLLGVAFLSSLAQALWAILLVYGGFFVLEVSARQLATLAEAYLAPASYIAVAAIGGVLALRGGRALWHHLAPGPLLAPKLALAGHDQHDAYHPGGHGHLDGHGHAQGEHDHDDCGCHAHGPRPEDVAALGSLRDAVALIGSIAIRPCTGAIFLLVIAWQMDIAWAGAAAVITMGLGTGMLTSLVAVSSVLARGLAMGYGATAGVLTLALPTLQFLSGLLIVWFSLVLLGLRSF